MTAIIITAIICVTIVAIFRALLRAAVQMGPRTDEQRGLKNDQQADEGGDEK